MAEDQKPPSKPTHIAHVDPAAYAKMTPAEKQQLVDTMNREANEARQKAGLPPLKKAGQP